jgi:hypothetical protein
LLKEGKGITSIANRLQAEAKAGEIAKLFKNQDLHQINGMNLLKVRMMLLNI